MTGRSTHRRPVLWWVVAALAAATSLGLPWGSRGGSGDVWVPGFITPASFVPSFDGTVEMMPGTVSYGFLVPGGTAAYAGYQTDARVVVALACVLLWLAVRRRSPDLALGGLAVAVLAVLLSGLVVTGGLLVYLAAVAAVVLALRADGLLPQRSAAAPSA